MSHNYLFPKFLDNAREYEQAEAWWNELWQRLLGEGPSRFDGWTSPWFEQNFANGHSQRDGNPIFSAVSRRLQRGIRVVQQEPVDDSHELSYWIDWFAAGTPDEIRELVIACVLSETVEQEVEESARVDA